MDVITMPSIPSLVRRLTTDFPDVSFVEGDVFQWSAKTRTITYRLAGDDTPHLLHELAHTILEHRAYRRDIELLKMERDAWAYAQDVLGPQYSVDIEDSHKEEALDSYRDWLHARSTCPNCQATGMETDKHTYLCPACRHTWRVNEARICGLKRYSTQK